MKNSKLIITIIILSITSCIPDDQQFHGLRKLSETELLERAKNNNFPDIQKVTYIMNNDTISIDSLYKLNYNEIAYDDYVNSNNEIVLSVVRKITEDDKVFRIKMENASMVYSLNGQLKSSIIESEYLNQEREITIYKPVKSKSNIYLYMTDGNSLFDIANSVDTLIKSQIIKPINLVGIHSHKDNRFKEYVKNVENEDYFNSHLDFFSLEVPQFVEQKEKNVEIDRYLIGFSNGADFANYIGINKPNWAKKIISMSGVAYFPKTTKEINLEIGYPEFILSSGVDEKLSNKNNRLINTLNELGAQVTYEEYDGGHEYEIWKQRFLNFVQDEFKQIEK